MEFTMLTGIAPQLTETEFKAFCKTVKGHATVIRRIGRKHGLDKRIFPDHPLSIHFGYGREFSGHVFPSMEAKQSWSRSNCNNLHKTNGFSGAVPEDFGATYHEILPYFAPRIEAANKEVNQTLSAEEMEWVMVLCMTVTEDMDVHWDPKYRHNAYYQLLENSSFFPYWSRGSTRDTHDQIKSTLEKHGHQIVPTPDEVAAQLEKRKQKAKKSLDKKVRDTAYAVENLQKQIVQWKKAHQALIAAAARFEDEWCEDYEVPRAHQLAEIAF
jgi:hypothetical protein